MVSVAALDSWKAKTGIRDVVVHCPVDDVRVLSLADDSVVVAGGVTVAGHGLSSKCDVDQDCSAVLRLLLIAWFCSRVKSGEGESLRIGLRGQRDAGWVAGRPARS